MLSKENVKDIYGLTPMQEGMLLRFASDPTSTAHTEQFTFYLESKINPAALQKSLDTLINKYDVLRTIFSFRKTDLPRQIVLKARKVQIQIESYAELDDSAAEASVARFKQQDRENLFDLSSDVLIRISLLTLAPTRHQMVLTFHHIILDGWCMGTLLGDFFGYYERFCNDPACQIDERESFPYRDYISWIGKQDKAKAEEYWNLYLKGYQTQVGVPYSDISHDGKMTHAEHSISLGKKLSARLAEIGSKKHMTVNSIFQTAWGILLQKYNNTDDVVFGTVVAGRPPELPGVEHMIGLFINTQPLRVACNSEEKFIDVAARVHESLFQSVIYDYYPLSSIQSVTPLKNKLLNHVVTFENLPISEQMSELNNNGNGLHVSDVQVFQAAKYDFQVIVYPGDDMRVSFVYNSSRYSECGIASIARSLTHLLTILAEAPEQTVASLGICGSEDAKQILEKFNDTDREYPANQSVTDLFLQTVDMYPTSIALRHADRNYTYRQLHAEALAVATHLCALGVQSGDTVALIAPRSVETVIGMLAILFCGATYIPVEPGSSLERVRYMIEDGNVDVLCTVEAYRGLVPEGVVVHFLDGAAALPLPGSHETTFTALHPDHPAYIIYTSGSTGKPKGCSVSHRNIVRLVRNTNYVAFGPEQRILQSCSPAFDVSTAEIWGALLNGGELCIIDEASIRDPNLLRAALKGYGITCMFTTTALFNQLCDFDAHMFQSLQYLMVGGEVLSPHHIERVRAANPHLTVLNGYGPTENTTLSTTFEVDRHYADGIPIGKPIANSKAYILDSGFNLLPPGAYGELCVGGDGVAIGYIKRPELNDEKFLRDPFHPGGRMYRTGDIARWLLDGNISIVGRNDFQVKIRGFRVELGEIERALCAVGSISEAAVVAHESPGGKQLHAFYVSGREISAIELRAALSGRLPSYMVPTFFLRLERMPLTVNGKLDRRALPIEESSAQRITALIAEPKSVTERRIADACKEVLGIEQIGIYDNFFEIGANSLNLIAINNRLKEIFSKEIPLAVLFEYTSVARLAEFIGEDQAAAEAKLASEKHELDQAKNALLKTRNLLRTLEES